MVQGQPISFIKKTVDEMLRLPNVEIIVPPNYQQDEVADMCIRVASKHAIVQKEGWKGS
jgi:hypothetical protein